VFAVRLLALATLVLWLGTMLTAVLGDLLGSIDQVGYWCGAIILACLFTMKFVGPAPPGFIPRAAIVAAMLATTFIPQLVNRLPISPTALVGSRIALGIALLAWYARE
jgi:hypothetical protein